MEKRVHLYCGVRGERKKRERECVFVCLGQVKHDILILILFV